MRSEVLKDEFYTHEGERYYGSGFNPLWLSEFGITPKCILDVGSYDGGDALRLKFAFPDADIFAIEPDPLHKDKVDRVQKYGVKVCNYAISNENEDRDFYQVFRSEGDPQAGSFLRNTAKYTETWDMNQIEEPIKVTAVTWDKFCIDNGITEVDFANIDVEGAVFDIMLGMTTCLPKLMWVELNNIIGMFDGYSPTETRKIIYQKGYDAVYEYGADVLFHYSGSSRE